MADFPAVSPLLDGFTVTELIASHNGVSCYLLRHDASGQQFVLKHISVPESEAKVQALLLSGAYASADEVNDYFKRVADTYAAEFELSKSFADCPNILPFLAQQTVKKEDAPGYDIYAVCDLSVSLKSYAEGNALTKLQAVNLGIDLCSALCALRSAGYIHQNIKPENIYVEGEQFRLGDLGLTAVEDMKYSSLPEQYFSVYTAPELSDIMSGQNASTDLYAVGMLLYRIYNGNHAPFEDERITAKEADHMRCSGKELPAPMYADYELAEILLKACAFKPEDRYQSPDELKRELVSYMQRNAVSDTLIVPPIVNDPEPELSPEDDDYAAPVSFTDVDTLDDDFVRHFSPDTATLDATIEKMKREDAQEAARSGAAQEEAPFAMPELTADADMLPVQDESTAAREEIPEAPVAAADAALPEQDPGEEAANDESAPSDGAAGKPLTLPSDTDTLLEEAHALSDAPASSESDRPLTLIEEAHSKDGADAADSGNSPADEADAAAPATAANANAEIPEEKPRGRKKSIAKWIVLSALVLVIAAVLVYFFTPLGQKIYHYTINIEQLNAQKILASEIDVTVKTNVEMPPIVLSCKDAYGNSFESELKNGKAAFTELESGTQYTITAVLKKDSGLHRLTGTTSVSVSTLPATEVLVMSVADGSQEGAAVIDLVLKDDSTQPSAWTVSYSCEGETDKEYSTAGSARHFEITGLTPEKEYTFTLVSSDLAALTGATSGVYTPPKEVTAEQLKAESLIDGALSLSWICTSENKPEFWEVSWTDDSGEESVTQTDQPAATITGLKLGTAYTVRVNARGLFSPLSFKIPENLIHIDTLSATPADDGLHVYWTSSGAAADGGWILLCIPCGNEQFATAYNVETNGIVLTDLLPGTTYDLILKSGNENPVVGRYSAKYTVPAAEEFNTRGMTVQNTAVRLYTLPEAEEWGRKDLSEPKTEFSAGEKVACKITSRTGRYQGSFSTLYIIRDENGVPVSSYSAVSVWNEAWALDNGSEFSAVGSIVLPKLNGTFTVEFYFSLETEGLPQYKYVCTSDPFTLTGAPEE